MGEQIAYLLGQVVIAQQITPEGSDSPARYIIPAIVGVAVLVLIFKGMGSKSADALPPSPEGPVFEGTPKTKDEIEAEARRVFEIPKVLVGESDEGESRHHVQITRTQREVETTRSAPAGSPDSSEGVAPTDKEGDGPPKPKVERAGKTLREGLARTHDGFVKKLGKLFGTAKSIDDDLLGDLEEALFMADIGVRTSQKLMDRVHEGLGKKALSDPKKVWSHLKDEITEMLVVDSKPLDLDRAKPMVIMVVGVNGAGKTTTIGKLARKFTDDGKKVLLAAGDTFRAAAVEQLEVWGDRAGVPVVRGADRQDPSSVIFDACKRAVDEGYDVCIADTAGRLQAKKELMDELRKVHRVIGKAVPGGPHEVWLVLDSTNGQNAISQAKEFTQTVDVSGLVLTKLDGTAKGGVVIGISDEMSLPVRYIGIGEQVEDLRTFDPAAFADALFAVE